MKKLLAVLLLLSLLVTCIPLAGAEDIEMKTVKVSISNEILKEESGVPVIKSGEAIRAYFRVLDKNNSTIYSDNVAIKYTVTRDADGADVSVIPQSNASERTVRSSYYTFAITDAKKMTPGTYTIKAKAVCTYKGYTGNPELTQKVIVSAEKAAKTGTITITNGDQSYYRPRFKIGETLTAAISAPGASKCEVYFEGKDYSITLTNGAGTFTSDPIKGSGSNYVELFSIDGEEYWNYDEDYFSLENGRLTVKFDKQSYSIGETANITLTCPEADYFEVDMRFKTKKELERKESERTMQGTINYKAVSGSATIAVPLTEAGWLYIQVDACKDPYAYLDYDYVEVQIDNPENIRSDSDDLVPPTNIKILPNAVAGLDLAWSASANANGYSVYRADSDTPVFDWIGTTDTTSYTDAEAPVGKVVYYRVVSQKTTADMRWTDMGYSEDAPFKSYMLLAKPKLKVNVKKAKTLGMSWKKVKGADYYEVYYNTKSTAPTASTKATLTVKDGVKVDATKKVKASKTYYCYVRAVKAFPDGTKVVGPWSKVVKKKAKK